MSRHTFGAMTYIVWQEHGRKRAGRSEPKLLGDIEADDDEHARRIAAERWPGLRLEIYRRRTDELRPSSPPRGA
jgi:hypothetical protein